MDMISSLVFAMTCNPFFQVHALAFKHMQPSLQELEYSVARNLKQFATLCRALQSFCVGTGLGRLLLVGVMAKGAKLPQMLGHENKAMCRGIVLEYAVQYTFHYTFLVGTSDQEEPALFSEEALSGQTPPWQGTTWLSTSSTLSHHGYPGTSCWPELCSTLLQHSSAVHFT